METKEEGGRFLKKGQQSKTLNIPVNDKAGQVKMMAKRKKKTGFTLAEIDREIKERSKKPKYLEKLKESHLIFIYEYTYDYDRTRAYLEAYPKCSYENARTRSGALLKEPLIQAELGKIIEAKKHRHIEAQDRILMELAGIAFSDVSEFMEIEEVGKEGKDGKTTVKKVPVVKVTDIEQLPRTLRIAVKEITTDRAGNIRIIFHDKLKALELLGKHLGMFEHQSNKADVEKGFAITVNRIEDNGTPSINKLLAEAKKSEDETEDIYDVDE